MPTEQKRRYTDHVKQTDDHDLLIRVHTKLDHICKNQTTNTKAIKDLTDKIDAKCEHRMETCDTRFDKRITSTTFWKFVGIVIFVFAVAFGISTTNLISLTKHRYWIETNVMNIGRDVNNLEKTESDIMMDKE